MLGRNSYTTEEIAAARGRVEQAADHLSRSGRRRVTRPPPPPSSGSSS